MLSVGSRRETGDGGVSDDPMSRKFEGADRRNLATGSRVYSVARIYSYFIICIYRQPYGKQHG